MLLKLAATVTLAVCTLATNAQTVLGKHTPKPTLEGDAPFAVEGAGKDTFTHYKVFGSLQHRHARPLVVLHGGPGVPSNYLLSLTDLSHRMPVVLYDQLGSGASTHLREKNGDTDFWTEQLFIDELHNLLAHLGIQHDYALLGHSWGGMLGSRFASQRPKGLKKLVIASSPASMDLWLEAANKLRKELPQDVQDTLDKHEADGTTDSEEYEEAVAVFYSRYVCRIDPFPKDVQDAF
ncbi:alpha/beta-hydrolase, partial [Auricularia subglabra TFB-10046 SS5]